MTEALFEAMGTLPTPPPPFFLPASASASSSSWIAASACWTASCLTSEWYRFSLCVYLKKGFLINKKVCELEGLRNVKKIHPIGGERRGRFEQHVCSSKRIGEKFDAFRSCSRACTVCACFEIWASFRFRRPFLVWKLLLLLL